MENKIKRIFYGFLSGNLSYGASYDEHKSAKNFARQLRERLEVEYPGVEIEVDYEIGSSFLVPTQLLASVEYENGELYTGNEENPALKNVNETAMAVWRTLEWLVGVWTEPSTDVPKKLNT